MALPDIRHRTGYVFVAVMVGHIILISTQVTTRSGVPVIQAVLFGAFGAVQGAAWGVVGGARNVWEGYVALRQVKAENDRLAGEVAGLRVRLQQERALASSAEELRRLLALRDVLPLRTTGAEVVGGSAVPDFRSITIGKGRNGGLRPDMAVMVPAGVVGRVVQAGARVSTVQLLIDSNAAAAATVERSRAQGIALGNGDGTLRLEYLSTTADVQQGDRVVTSGIDRVYPKGLTIGYVERVERRGPAYRSVIIRPAVDFSGLETVLVVIDAPAPPDGGPGPS